MSVGRAVAEWLAGLGPPLRRLPRQVLVGLRDLPGNLAHGRFHTNARLILWFPTAVFAFLTVIVALGPALSIEGGERTLPEAVERGRDTYRSLGCSYCHTQQVRSDERLAPGEDGHPLPLAQDARYGRAARASDYAGVEWPFLGTQRNGPDLMNVGERIPSRDWHLLHLYDPRLVVPGSIMPTYRALFRGKEDHESDDRPVTVPQALKRQGIEVWATPRALDLVAYLLWLRPHEE